MSASLLAIAVAGSLIHGGPVYVDKTLNAGDAQCYGSGCYQVYRETWCTATGASAGNKNYNSCLQANPFDGTNGLRTASGVLTRVEFDVDRNGSGVNIDLGPVTALTGSSQTLLNNQPLGSGSVVGWSAHGSGGLVVKPGDSIKGLFTHRPDVNYTRVLMKTFWREKEPEL